MCYYLKILVYVSSTIRITDVRIIDFLLISGRSLCTDTFIESGHDLNSVLQRQMVVSVVTTDGNWG